jgi:hypothetical protein
MGHGNLHLKPSNNQSRGRAYLWRLITGFPPQRLWFNPMTDHVGFVVDKMILGQVFSKYFGFRAVSPSTDCSMFINRHYVVSIMTEPLNNTNHSHLLIIHEYIPNSFDIIPPVWLKWRY